MFSFLDPLRELTFSAIFLRMILAFVCGGVIGLEREFKRRPAGFRTHILICLGAAMTTLTSQYLCLVMHYDTDLARLGAQVVAGIGFIGAGSIIVTRRQRVRGLTTAAGLWSSAIVGLAIGAGFYEGAVFAAVLILLAELVFSRLEYYILRHAPEINLYMEYVGPQALDQTLELYQRWKVKVLSLEITRETGSESHNACAIFSLRLDRGCVPEQLLNTISGISGVISLEEL